MASAGKGLPFIGKLNEFIDRVLHPTVQKVGNSRAALDVVNRGYYLVDTNPLVVEAGSTDGLLVKTGHAFKVGDSIRLTNTSNGINEQEIIIDEIIDANTVKFAGYLSAPLVAGDEYFHRRPTAELLASDGTRLASLSFIEERTAGNETAVPVRRSYVDDVNTHALPVEIMGADGMVLNVTTGDINMQLRHDDRTINTVIVPGDSVKIGDGARLLGITTNNEAKVKDADAIAQLTAINANTDAIETKIDATNTALGTLNAKDFATSAKQDAGNTSLSTIAAKDFATQTTLAALLTELQAKADLTETQPVSGIVSVSSSALPTGAATEARQVLQLAQEAIVATAVGAPTDAAASSDTGTFNIIQFLKRGMQNWTTLLGKLPALGAQVVGSSISIVQATSHTFAVKEAQSTPSYQQSLIVANTGITTLSPAGAVKGCKVMAGYGNSADLKFTVDGATNPSATVGFELQPGRSEDFEGALEVRVIAKTTATNQEIYVHWRV